MKKYILVIILLVGSLGVVFAWGAWGHQHINRSAVFALPSSMRGFFYNHIDFITEESVVPDLRKYTNNDKAEFPRHYIDLESYYKDGSLGKTPAVFDLLSVIKLLPATMKEAKEVYADTFLTKQGILPWYIQEVEEKLTAAFRAGRKTEILFLAADLGHYIGDAHMPLHTALNHDGLLTDQKGIHALWEAQLPESFGDAYNMNTGAARYISDIGKETWMMIDSTHRLVEKMLAIDRELAASMPREKVYMLDDSGKVVGNRYKDPVHTREYAAKYHARLAGMVEAQLRGAIAETASYWYTAWVNAGSPDLSVLDPVELTVRNLDHLLRDYGRWRMGKVELFRPGGDFTPWVGKVVRKSAVTSK